MNLRDFLTEHGIPFKEHGEHHHVSPNWYGVDCPWCSPGSGRYRLGINLGSLACSCWACGPHPIMAALAILAGLPIERIKGLSFVGMIARKLQTCRGTLKLPKIGPLLPAHRKYLQGRGFDPDEVERLWGVKGIGKDGGNLKWRLFIPVVLRGETVSWTTRAISDSTGLRYVSAKPGEEALPHKQQVYGMDYVRHTAIVCEGPTDCWRIGPGAVCTLGTSFTNAQVNILSYVPRLAVAYDPEPPAQRQALRLAHRLAAAGCEVVNVDLGTVDPGDAPERTVASLRRRYLDD